jgi:wyosine [tRNA(Phe)-imidazoG37] synthetase (radical SAM superfamily)
VQVVSDAAQLLAVPQRLRDLGALKLTFVGGEPFLHPAAVPMIKAAKASGLTTCVVTNASLLDERMLRELQGHLDCLSASMPAVTRCMRKLARPRSRHQSRCAAA